MIEFEVDMGYLLEEEELDRVILNDENGEHEPMTFWSGGGERETCHEQERIVELETSVRAHEQGMRTAWAEYEKRDELIRDLYGNLRTHVPGCAEAFAKRMRELGIEVDE